MTTRGEVGGRSELPTIGRRARGLPTTTGGGGAADY